MKDIHSTNKEILRRTGNNNNNNNNDDDDDDDDKKPKKPKEPKKSLKDDNLSYSSAHNLNEYKLAKYLRKTSLKSRYDHVKAFIETREKLLAVKNRSKEKEFPKIGSVDQV